jgi:hypothetical protein
MLAEDRTRLQKIDELYALRLDQYVSLPQVSSHVFRVPELIKLITLSLLLLVTSQVAKAPFLRV